MERINVTERIRYRDCVRVGHGYVDIPVIPIREEYEVTHKTYVEVWFLPRSMRFVIKLFKPLGSYTCRLSAKDFGFKSEKGFIYTIVKAKDMYSSRYGCYVTSIVSDILDSYNFAFVRHQRHWLTDYEKSVVHMYFTHGLDEDWVREQVNLDEIEDEFSRYFKQMCDEYNSWCRAMDYKRAAFMKFLKSRKGLKWLCEEMRKCNNHERDLIIGHLDEDSLWIYYQNHQNEFIGLLNN